MNKLNEMFYVSKNVFISKLNEIIKLKTNLDFKLNVDHLFSYDFKNTSNEYLFNNLKLSYLYEVNEKSNLLNSLSWVIEDEFIDDIKNNSLIKQKLISINKIINLKNCEVNNMQMINNNLLEELINEFKENYLVRNYAIDNNQYFKNVASELLAYQFTDIIKYEFNYLLIGILCLICILIMIVITLVIRKIKRKKITK